jgi:hypothetical protein
MGMIYRGTQGCMYCTGECTKECIKESNNIITKTNNTEDTIFNQMLLVGTNIHALKFRTNIDESSHKTIIESYDILTNMIFKYIEKLKQNENEN